MLDLNLQFVREFFELNLFRVLTHWQHQELNARGADPGPLLFVEHSSATAANAIEPALSLDNPGFLLRPNDVPHIRRAVVEVRAWHADRFYPSVIENNSILAHVAGKETADLANNVFGTPEFTTILIISELPNSPEPRKRSLELLQGLGIGHVLEFSTLLQEIIERLNAHGNYAPSQTLQTIRLLKRYNLISLQQLEFAFTPEAPAPPKQPEIETDPQEIESVYEDDD